jgi:hypothetical protein
MGASRQAVPGGGKPEYRIHRKPLSPSLCPQGEGADHYVSHAVVVPSRLNTSGAPSRQAVPGGGDFFSGVGTERLSGASGDRHA